MSLMCYASALVLSLGLTSPNYGQGFDLSIFEDPDDGAVQTFWEARLIENAQAPRGQTPIFAYLEETNARPILFGQCQTDGQTSLALVNLRAEIGDLEQGSEVEVDFAIFGSNSYTASVQRIFEDDSDRLTFSVPLDGDLVSALRGQVYAAYRVNGTVEHLDLTGSATAIDEFIAECRTNQRAANVWNSTYDTCRTLGPRTRSPIRREVTITNSSGDVRFIRRLGSEGSLHGRQRLNAGQTIRLDSRVHTIYQFEDESGNCIQRTRVQFSDPSITLQAPNKIQL